MMSMVDIGRRLALPGGGELGVVDVLGWDPGPYEDASEDDWRPQGGTGSDGGGRRRGSDRAYNGLSLSPDERIGRLASGAQPAVLKIASYASLSGGSFGSSGSLAAYASRQGELPVETPFGSLEGLDAIRAEVDRWGTTAQADDVRPVRSAAFSIDLTVRLDDVFEMGEGTLVPTTEGAGRVKAAANEIVRATVLDRPFGVSIRSAEPDPDDPRMLQLSLVVLTPVQDRWNSRLQFGEEGRTMLQERACSHPAVADATVRFRRGMADERALAERGTSLLREQSREFGPPFSDVGSLDGPSSAKRFAARVQQEHAARQVDRARKRQDVMHLVLSSRAGTDPGAFKDAAHAFLEARFPGHRYMLAIHGPDDVEAKRTEHVHAHIMLECRGPQGKLRTSPTILNEWRADYAQKLSEHGIETVATARQDLVAERAYEARHAARMARGQASARDRERVSAKRDQRVPRPVGEAGRNAAFAVRDSWERVAASEPKSAENVRQSGLVTRMLFRARFAAQLADDQPIGSAIMSVAARTIQDLQVDRPVPDTLELERVMREIEVSVPEGDRPIVAQARAGVIAFIRDADRELEQALVSVQRPFVPGAEQTRPDEDASVGRFEALTSDLALAEQKADNARMMFDRAHWEHRLDPAREALFDEADRQLGAVHDADTAVNMAIAALALDAARSNRAGMAFIDHLHSNDDRFSAIHDHVVAERLHERPIDEARTALRELVLGNGPSAFVQDRYAAMVERSRDETAVLYAIADRDVAEAVLSFEPAASPAEYAFVSELDVSEGLVLATIVEEAEDARQTVMAKSDFSNEVEAARGADASGTVEKLEALDRELTLSENVLRDRLASLALEAANDKGLRASIEPHAPADFMELIDWIEDEGVAAREGASIVVRAAVRPQGRSEVQAERQTTITKLTQELVLSGGERSQNLEGSDDEHVPATEDEISGEVRADADGSNADHDAVQQASAGAELLARHLREEAAGEDEPEQEIEP